MLLGVALIALVAAVGIARLGGGFPGSNPLGRGHFESKGSIGIERTYNSATLLSDGRVLVVGGKSVGAASSVGAYASAELYDPTTGRFTTMGSMAVRRESHSATRLQDGRVLIAGGHDGTTSFGVALATAELYDPATGSFSPTGSMIGLRADQTATLLADGRVLLAGGDDGQSALPSAELYDPGTGTFGPAGRMTAGRISHSATLLADGQVLIAGGEMDATAELFDPTDNTFSAAAGSMSSVRPMHASAALKDGRVLIVGGWSQGRNMDATAELYDPKAGTFSTTGAMETGRGSPTATVLSDGRVLIAGGAGSSGSSDLAELYDPKTGEFSAAGTMTAEHPRHTATMLLDGHVLISGGTGQGIVEIYVP